MKIIYWKFIKTRKYEKNTLPKVGHFSKTAEIESTTLTQGPWVPNHPPPKGYNIHLSFYTTWYT